MVKLRRKSERNTSKKLDEINSRLGVISAQLRLRFLAQSVHTGKTYGVLDAASRDQELWELDAAIQRLRVVFSLRIALRQQLATEDSWDNAFCERRVPPTVNSKGQHCRAII